MTPFDYKAISTLVMPSPVGCALLLMVVGNGMLLRALRAGRLSAWRREVQLAILSTPLLYVLINVSFIETCRGGWCGAPMASPVQLSVLVTIFRFATVLIPVVAIGLGVAKHLALLLTLRRGTFDAPSNVMRTTELLAARFRTTPPRLRLRCSSRPEALTYGLRRSTIVLSTWMLERLDTEELEAVLAHELAHAVRRDYLVVWLASVLRDAFFYLPTSWVAFHALQDEKEVACDDLAAAATHFPLGLAGALAKVWQDALLRPQNSYSGLAQLLTGAHAALEGRIARLLAMPVTVTPACDRRHIHALSATVGLWLTSAVCIVALLTAMGCLPVVSAMLR